MTRRSALTFRPSAPALVRGRGLIVFRRTGHPVSSLPLFGPASASSQHEYARLLALFCGPAVRPFVFRHFER